MELLILIIIIGIVIYYFRKKKDKKASSEQIDKVNELNKFNDSENKNKIKNGKFQVSGYHHLPEDVKKIVWKKLKVGDDLQLLPDAYNKYDKKAIKVIFEGNQIGWVSKGSYRKNELFNLLLKNTDVKAKCARNIGAADGGAGGLPYLGMAQFVEVKYEVIYSQ